MCHFYFPFQVFRLITSIITIDCLAKYTAPGNQLEAMDWHLDKIDEHIDGTDMHFGQVHVHIDDGVIERLNGLHDIVALLSLLLYQPMKAFLL